MPKDTRVSRCVEKLKGKKGINAYAVCQSSTGQNYATGKKLKEDNAGGDNMAATVLESDSSRERYVSVELNDAAYSAVIDMLTAGRDLDSIVEDIGLADVADRLMVGVTQDDIDSGDVGDLSAIQKIDWQPVLCGRCITMYES